ncbi:sugar phosphate isomerase/epimerase [Paenibacillus sp. HWE-109]|uniref:D-psicose 3-epimerase n=1 Tax=Paenibacillus sp. HWE-109 TaxID=1306526 RepID=UPI001EDDB2A2|nr:sugar phosphate isomerase/epimerase family protein [Paenibacillus sp. HWE-109]UKS24504.1 sugar phosphate isomerase/epimerase [Paenibacillus sp. HWE-109]
MYKYGVHSSFGEKDWNFDLFKAVKRHALNGFDVVEIFIPTLLSRPKHEYQALKQLADECGIEMTYSTGLAKEHDLSSKDEHVRRQAIEYVKNVLEIIASMGGKAFGGVNYAAWAGKLEASELGRNDYVENSLKSMKELATTAEDLGITYMFEVVNRFETTVMNTAEEGLAFIDKIGSPNCKLLLDTFHMNIEEVSLTDAIIRAGDQLACLHLGECNRSLPSREGRTDWMGLYRALKSIQFDGILTIESFITTGGEIGRDIGLYRDLTFGQDERQLDMSIRESLQFLKSLEN